MTDDAERAAKAARAKAMLKKRQQQKAGVPSPSPSPALARSLSPVSTPRSPDHKDVALLFGDHEKDPIDLEEFGVLRHAKGPVSPSPVTSPSASALTITPTSPPHPHNGDASDELRTLIKNQQQTISLLVNEKASLTSQLERLEDLAATSTEHETLLNGERRRADGMAARLRHVEEQARASADRLDELTRREREANERCRDQDLELDLIRRSAGELKTQLDNRERELKELRDRVEADDRVDTLEKTLQGTQNRAEELEFQLSKVTQLHTSTIRERDSLQDDLAELGASESEWRQRHATLEQDSASAQHEIATLSASLDTAEHARTDLEDHLATNETALASAQQQLANAASELASYARQLHAANADVAHAHRRADDAETAQRSLQAENSGLLAQLEEVRPKVVELSNKGAADEERIWETEKRCRTLEAAVTRLEALVDERRAAEEVERRRADRLKDENQRDTAKHDRDIRELEQAYAMSTRELETANALAAKLERDIGERRRVMQARERDSIHWKAQAEERQAEMEELKNELSARRKDEDDGLAIVQRTQAEVETLRDQLALREDEVARLREAPTTSRSASPHGGVRQTLVEEMLGSARQQHALDLSTSHSRIRELETQVFDTQAQAHTFQRRVTALEDELALLRAAPPEARSPPPFPRGSSFYSGGSDSRRLSLNSLRPHTPSTSYHPLIAPRAVYEDNLSAETRHKRKVSLSMLKARIESERAAAVHAESLVTSIRRGSSSVSIAEADEQAGGAQTPRRGSDDRASLSHSTSHSRLSGLAAKRPPSQFLDESHVFWCHCCHKDLVVL